MGAMLIMGASVLLVLWFLAMMVALMAGVVAVIFKNKYPMRFQGADGDAGTYF